jgi:hypothetical protein
VKLLASAAALACVLVLLLPSASANRGGGGKRPFDFELTPHSGDAVAAGGEVRSRPLRTPHRFNLVGMRWRGRAQPGIELRVRHRGRWSRWEELAAHADHNPDLWRGERVAAASDPIWVGEAGAVQYTMSRRVAGLRLHFVNVGSRRYPVNTRARAAQEPEPSFVSRAEWGAADCPPRAAPEYGEVRAVQVHHTVSLNDYTPDESPAMVLAICRYHRNSNGWNDIGYNALVDKYGTLFEGRAGGLDKPVIAAQAQGFNAQTAGIANIGDHSSLPQTDVALAAIARYIRWKLPISGQPTSGPVTLVSAGGPLSRYPAGANVTVERVIGHRDTGKTVCPGDALYAQLPKLRAMVGSGAPAPLFATRLSGALGDEDADYREPVPVTGSLAAPDGSALPGETVELQVNTDGAWRTVKRLTTRADGTFSSELRPRLRMYVRVRYRGRGELRGTSSTRLLLHVRSLVAIDDAPSRGKAGVRVPVTGRVAPGKGAVYLVLQQNIGGRFRQVGVRAVKVRRGRFEGSFVPGSRTLYRFYVVAKTDDDTDRGSSDRYVLRVARAPTRR